VTKKYPQIQAYKRAMQKLDSTFPHDKELRGDILRDTQNDIIPLSGAFAVVFRLTTHLNKIIAIRCFHGSKVNQIGELSQRYLEISKRLQQLKSNYFLIPEFQPKGVVINNEPFPLIKMPWASGEQLFVFLEKNYNNTLLLQNLDSSLRELAFFLENEKIAHGDIQPENLLVSPDGRGIQLIDYDGMYVEALQSLKKCVEGKPNFQHPKRELSNAWNERLDRFSFILLHLALKAFEEHPKLRHQTEYKDRILLQKEDFDDPQNSPVLKQLLQSPSSSQLQSYARQFNKICRSPFKDIPTLEEFIAGTTKTAIPPQPLIPYPQGSFKPSRPVQPPHPLTPLEHIQQALKIIGKNITTRLQRLKENTVARSVKYIIGFERIQQALKTIGKNIVARLQRLKENIVAHSVKYLICVAFFVLLLASPDILLRGVHILEQEIFHRLYQPMKKIPHSLRDVQQYLTSLISKLGQQGNDSSIDPELTSEWAVLLEQANQGHATAQNILGMRYADGRGVVKNEREAVKWFQKAADQGHAHAQANLGVMHTHGRGVTKDDRKAAEWYRKAANQGHVSAQYNLGWSYAGGHGVIKNEREAVKWFQKAANQGHAHAQTGLQELLESLWRQRGHNDHPWLVSHVQHALTNLRYSPGPVDRKIGTRTEQALSNYMRSTKKDLKDALATLMRVSWVDGKQPDFMPKKGEYGGGVFEGSWSGGIPQGRGKWTTPDGVFEGDFVNGKLHGKVKASFPSGDVFEGDFVNGAITGKGKLTTSRGVVYEGDFVNGQRHGKGILTTPKGVFEGDFVNDEIRSLKPMPVGSQEKETDTKPQPTRYLRYLAREQERAEQGNATAQNNLGVMYANGRGVAKDDRSAVEWFQKAANQGYAAAQANLGEMYADGRGVAKDERKAVEWFQKAADQGLANAQENLQRRLETMWRQREHNNHSWLVSHVQRALAQRRYSPGPVNGKIDSRTEQALSNYMRSTRKDLGDALATLMREQ